MLSVSDRLVPCLLIGVRWHLAVRGKVVEITEKGADAHIDALAKMYMGLDTYPFHQPGVQRVIYKIEPLRCSTMG